MASSSSFSTTPISANCDFRDLEVHPSCIDLLASNTPKTQEIYEQVKNSFVGAIAKSLTSTKVLESRIQKLDILVTKMPIELPLDFLVKAITYRLLELSKTFNSQIKDLEIRYGYHQKKGHQAAKVVDVSPIGKGLVDSIFSSESQSGDTRLKPHTNEPPTLIVKNDYQSNYSAIQKTTIELMDASNEH